MADELSGKAYEGSVNGRKGYMIQMKHSDLPDGSIRLTQQAVAAMRMEVIRRHSNKYDTWSMLYSQYILMGSAFLSAAIVTYTLRRKLNLKYDGWGTNYAIMAVGPIAITGALHDIVMQRVCQGDVRCPVCLPLKSCCLNVFAGWAVPTFISVFTTAHLARRFATFPIPPLNEWRPLIKELNILTRKHRPLYAAVLVCQIVLPFLLTVEEQQAVRRVGLTADQIFRKVHGDS